MGIVYQNGYAYLDGVRLPSGRDEGYSYDPQYDYYGYGNNSQNYYDAWSGTGQTPVPYEQSTAYAQAQTPSTGSEHSQYSQHTPTTTATPAAPTSKAEGYDISQNASAMTPDYSLNYQPDSAGQAYIDAMNRIADDLGEKPTYDDRYDRMLEESYNNIVNRDPFSWNADDDEFYKAYEQRFTDLGQKAMKDTMGQAAALTGGYGNTYSQYVGQAAYNDWMDALMDKSVELEQRAYDRYMDAGRELYNQFGLLSDLRDNAYGQYRDAVSDYNYNLALLQAYEADNYARAQYNNNLRIEAEQTGYARSLDRLQQLQYEDNYNYNKWRDEISDIRYNDETAYSRYRDTVADDQWAQELAYKYAALNDSGSGSSSRSGRGGGSGGSGGYSSGGGSYSGYPESYANSYTNDNGYDYSLNGYTGEKIYTTQRESAEQAYYEDSLQRQYVATTPTRSGTTSTSSTTTGSTLNDKLKLIGKAMSLG